jgi:hypothetical protein
MNRNVVDRKREKYSKLFATLCRACHPEQSEGSPPDARHSLCRQGILRRLRGSG